MTTRTAPVLTRLFAELVDGAAQQDGAFILNSGDAGLLRSLEKITAAAASRSLDGGASIAAHAQHLRDGLSLMNRWARDGGDPFADPAWDAAWKITAVDEDQWEEIRRGLAQEVRAWAAVLTSRHDVNERELAGMIGSLAHLAYHVGAIRQISRHARGPREGTFSAPAR